MAEKAALFLKGIENGTFRECCASWDLVTELAEFKAKSEEINGGKVLKKSPLVSSRYEGTGSARRKIYCFGGCDHTACSPKAKKAVGRPPSTMPDSDKERFRKQQKDLSRFRKRIDNLQSQLLQKNANGVAESPEFVIETPDRKNTQEYPQGIQNACMTLMQGFGYRKVVAILPQIVFDLTGKELHANLIPSRTTLQRWSREAGTISAMRVVKRLQQLQPEATCVLHDTSATAGGAIGYKQACVGVSIEDPSDKERAMCGLLAMQPVHSSKSQVTAGLIKGITDQLEAAGLPPPSASVADHAAAERRAGHDVSGCILGCHHHKVGNAMKYAQFELASWSTERLNPSQSDEEDKDIVGDLMIGLVKQLDPSYGRGCGGAFRSKILRDTAKHVWRGLGFVRYRGTKWGARSFNNSRLLHHLDTLRNMATSKELNRPACSLIDQLDNPIAKIDMAVSFVLLSIHRIGVSYVKKGEVNWHTAEKRMDPLLYLLHWAKDEPHDFLASLFGTSSTASSSDSSSTSTTSSSTTSSSTTSASSDSSSTSTTSNSTSTSSSSRLKKAGQKRQLLETGATAALAVYSDKKSRSLFLDAFVRVVTTYEETLRRFIDDYKPVVSDELKRAAAATTDRIESAFGVASNFGKRSMLYSPYRIASHTLSICNQKFRDVVISKEELRICRRIARDSFVVQQRFAKENDDICREEAKASKLSSLYLGQLLQLAEKCGVEPPTQRAKKDVLVELLFAKYESIEKEVLRMMAENEEARKQKKTQKTAKTSSRADSQTQPAPKVTKKSLPISPNATTSPSTPSAARSPQKTRPSPKQLSPGTKLASRSNSLGGTPRSKRQKVP